MSAYRAYRSADGSYVAHGTSSEEEIGRAVGTAAGWALGAGVDLAGAAARGIRDRRMLRAAEAMMQAGVRGDDDALLALATEFTRRYPREEFGHEQRAQALWAKRRYEESLSELDRAVELGLDEWDARLARGQVLSDSGSSGAALREFTSLIEHPKYRAQGFMGRALCLLELKDFDEALTNANEAVAAMPDEDSYQVRAIVHWERGDSRAALIDINRVIQMCPDEADHLNFRAQLHDDIGDNSAAERDREKAAALVVPPSSAVLPSSHASAAAQGDALAVNGRDPLPADGVSVRRDTHAHSDRREWVIIAVGTAIVLMIATVASLSVSSGLIGSGSTDSRASVSGGGGVVGQPVSASAGLDPTQSSSPSISSIVASSTSPDSQDATGSPVSFSAANLIDGREETAWRCDGDGVGQTINVNFSRPTYVSRIGLIPGYAKTDPADGTNRYLQNGRVATVLLRFDDGSSVRWTLDAGPSGRYLQEVYLEQPTLTASIIVTILDSIPGQQVGDQSAVARVAISEFVTS